MSTTSLDCPTLKNAAASPGIAPFQPRSSYCNASHGDMDGLTAPTSAVSQSPSATASAPSISACMPASEKGEYTDVGPVNPNRIAIWPATVLFESVSAKNGGISRRYSSASFSGSCATSPRLGVSHCGSSGLRTMGSPR
ncbi:Uncharacterised protein [Mycobacteroides abscessus subsp. abscessus]|nr:Uncharacterised protein [Mycobacteroides abscessus subsp. abscessus]